MNIKSANGVQGQLIYCGDGQYRFRVYTETFEFTDYDLLHYDLSVTITDWDASLYSDENGDRLDHSPATLGLQNQLD
jgi:hypothetical protein